MKKKKKSGSKRIWSAVMLVVGMALLVAGVSESQAQDAKPYSLLSGGTNRLLATATNSAIYLAVSEFNEMGLQASANGHSGTASNVQFHVYRSIDSTTYEGDIYSTLQLRLSGTATNACLTNLTLYGVASIKIVPANTNGVVITNLVLKARFKAPKMNDI